VLGDELVAAVLADHRTAPVGTGVRATLDLLQAVTLHPVDVSAADVNAVRAAGVSDEGIVDALYVCVYFNFIDRVADALGFDLPTAEEHAEYAPQFLEEGYGNEL